MSIQALNWALNQDVIENSGAKFVLMILSNYADEDGYCYPSRETIALKTGLKVRAVQNHLNWLVDEDYIVRKSRRFDKKVATNCYQVQFKEMSKTVKNLSAESAPSPQNLSAESAGLSAENGKNLSADSALTYKEDTKAVKEDTSAQTQNAGGRVDASSVNLPTSKTAIPITRIDPAEKLPDKFTHARQIWDYLAKKRMDTPFENPKWETAIDYAYRRNFSAGDFTATVEHLQTDPEEIKWRKGRLTAETVTNNLQKVWDLRAAGKRAAGAAIVDFSKCPDCDSRGMKQITVGSEKRMVKCRHEKLAAVAG